MRTARVIALTAATMLVAAVGCSSDKGNGATPNATSHTAKPPVSQGVWQSHAERGGPIPDSLYELWADATGWHKNDLSAIT
ncbi:MAG: hypothetical protein QOH57_5429, partial [Mycobacterium sp.]|nr:hypothetical protein [Mycobacterium sp.]